LSVLNDNKNYHELVAGAAMVIINGKVALDGGDFKVDELPGKMLRRDSQ